MCSVLYPDPAFPVYPDTDPVLRTKNWRKNTTEIFFLFLIKNCNLLIGLLKRRPNYRRSIPYEKENIRHFKQLNLLTFFKFCGSFLPSWIRIPLNPDQDPDPQDCDHANFPLQIQYNTMKGFSNTSFFIFCFTVFLWIGNLVTGHLQLLCSNFCRLL